MSLLLIYIFLRCITFRELEDQQRKSVVKLSYVEVSTQRLVINIYPHVWHWE